MTDDESLEKKSRRAEKLNNVLSVITYVTGFAAGAFLGYIKGDENGYAEGKKACVAEAQAPEVEIKLFPSGRQSHVMVLITQNKDGKKLEYNMWAAPNRIVPGELSEDSHIDITEVSEQLNVETDDGVRLLYSDGDIDVPGYNGDFCWGGPRDGLVDSILSSPDNGMSPLLCRVRDYETNKAVFDEADALFKEFRDQFYVSE